MLGFGLSTIELMARPPGREHFKYAQREQDGMMHCVRRPRVQSATVWRLRHGSCAWQGRHHDGASEVLMPAVTLRAHREGAEGGGVDLVLSGGHDGHQAHVRDAVQLQDGVHWDQRPPVAGQAPQQRQVPPARTRVLKYTGRTPPPLVTVVISLMARPYCPCSRDSLNNKPAAPATYGTVASCGKHLRLELKVVPA